MTVLTRASSKSLLYSLRLKMYKRSTISVSITAIGSIRTPPYCSILKKEVAVFQKV
jgi:hypothetical protein